MDPELGLLNSLGRLARDQNFRGITALSIGRAVAVAAGKRRGEVDGRIGNRLDQLDVLAVTATQELVHGWVERRGINDSPKLYPS
jgi:hypothetical protein